ncbi:MAG: TlyA family RNA methyltransferase [Limnochordaceae bacterium]|nr:TlyA family RNA methyltransferase [Limnochordaceae bacterium]
MAGKPVKHPRADQALVEQALARSREEARQLILMGAVRAGEQVISRPGQRIDPGVRLEVAGPRNPYVSRGGLKLQRVLEEVPVPVEGAVCMDVGASTGGFTDCLLRHGARKVYAVDVGYGQLAWKLRNDPRVVVLERTNIRYLPPERIGEPLDVITVDTSFISVTLFLAKLRAMLRPEGWAVVLVKPQFEAGRAQVKRGGVVKDPGVHRQVLEKVASSAVEAGFRVEAVLRSPLLGPKGNLEFFEVLRPLASRGSAGMATGAATVDAMIERALAEPVPRQEEAGQPRSGS